MAEFSFVPFSSVTTHCTRHYRVTSVTKIIHARRRMQFITEARY